MRRKDLSLVLAMVLVMALVLVPNVAFASSAGGGSDIKLPDAYVDSNPVDGKGTGTITVTNSGAEGQPVEATNFAEAVQKVTDGGTITISSGKIELSNMADFSQKSVTIKSDDGSAIVRGANFTDTMFKVGADKSLTIEGVTIDAGGKWTVDNVKLKKSVELSLNGQDALDGSANYINGAENPVIPNEGNIVSSGNLFEINGGSKLVFDKGAIVKNYYRTNGHIINITGNGANIDFKECHIEHNLTSGSGIVNYGGNSQIINILNGAEFANNFTTEGHGGIVYLRGANSKLNIGENSSDSIHIHDNISMKCNGGIVITYSGGVATLNGGIIENNIAVRGSGSTYAMMFYAHNNGTIIINGGSILNNVGSSVSTISQNIGGAGKVELNGGTIKGNRHANEALGAFGAQGDVFISAEGKLGANMDLEDDLYIYGQGIFTMEEGSTVKGDVCVYSEQYQEVENNEVNLKGKIEGSLYIQDGAKVENSGEITGNVILVERDEDDSQNNLFTNKGKVNGNIQLAKGGKAVNEGTIQGSTDVKAGAELVLHGNGALQGTVTVYPGGDIRAAENDNAVIDGQLIIEYKDEEDLQRMQDIFRGSGITIKSGEAPKYKLHEHAEGAQVTDKQKAPTCTEPGYETFTCTTCLDEYQKVKSATGHTKNSGTMHNTADCTVADYTEFECNVCGTKWTEVTKAAKAHTLVADAASGGFKCTACNYTVIPTGGSASSCTSGHTWDSGIVAKAASCTEAGTRKLTCTVCGATMTITVPATGHTWGNLEVDESDSDNNKTASCTEEGKRSLVKKCTVCEAVDETSRVVETIPMVDHTVPAGMFGTGSDKHKCTDEFTYTCSVCSKENLEFRGKAHTWGENGTGTTCTVCGQTRTTTDYVNIAYQYPGAVNPPLALQQADHILYAKNSTATLWMPAEGETWTETFAGVPAVFVGWSETHIVAPYATDPAKGTLLPSSVSLGSSEIQVYAVWAEDRNGNGTADYTEKRYSITFDLNGGTGADVAQMTDLLPGMQYVLPQPTELTKGDAKFAGWLNTKVDHSYDSSHNEHNDLLHSYTAETAADVTLYAVYADDSYAQGSVQVHYHANGGIARAGSGITVGDDDIFYSCTHFHQVLSFVSVDEMFSLTSAQNLIERSGAVLVGWSDTQQSKIFESAEEVNAVLTHGVTMGSNGATLYAVWAVDKTGDGVADYLENQVKLTHTWFDNANLGGTLEDGITPDIKGAIPEATSGHNIGDYIEFDFSGNTLTRTDYNADNKLYHHYVHLGWSGYVHGLATNASQVADWLLVPDDNPSGESGKTYRWLRDTRFQTAYAVWAYDDNQNGKADFAEESTTPPTTDPDTPTSPSTNPGTSSTTDPGTLTPEVRPNTSGEVNTTIQAQAVSDGIRDAQKNKDDSVVIAPQVEGETDKVTVTVPKTSVGDVGKAGLELRVETPLGNVTLPADSAKELARKDGSRVTVSVEAKEDGTTGIEIRTGNEVVDQLSGGLNVELPAETGNVLVVVNPDGTETVVKKSVVDEKTAKALLDGSCNVKVEDRSKDFDDVADGSWFEDAVDFASSHELFEGVTKTTFDPDGSMTRGMLATVLWRLEGEAETAATDAFQDIASGSWFEEGIAWANAKGIVQGYGDGTFGPDDNITREQLATMLYRYARQLGMNTRTSGSLSSFPDESSVSSYATEAMQWAVGNGLVNGMADGTLNPGGNATRAQVATIIQRLITLMVK